MSQKKHKKRHPQAAINAKRQAAQAKLDEEKARARSRLDPTARGLLFGDLVFIAVSQLLYSNGLINDLLSGICAIIGTVLLLLALWLQFGKKKDPGEGGGGSWPGLR